jgi:hypothetical protein
LKKSKSNRDGLIQQIVTYVRDGHTITRKQWVRSTFADHAKKNEEEKKKGLLEEKQKEDAKHTKVVEEENAKMHTKDVRAHKKQVAQNEETLGHTARNKKIDNPHMDKYKKELDKKKKHDEEERKKKDKHDKDKKKDKKDKRASYGQQDQTRTDNKAEQKIMQS